MCIIILNDHQIKIKLIKLAKIYIAKPYFLMETFIVYLLQMADGNNTTKNN